MRIKIILLTLMLALASLTGQAQNNVFDKLERKDIKTVHVSKSLLEMISKMDNTGGANIVHLADKLKQIDIYTSESNDAANFMNSQAELLSKNKSYETFMSVKEKDQTTTFYGLKSGDKFNDLVMVIAADNNCKIMRFVGNFTAKDIQQVIKK